MKIYIMDTCTFENFLLEFFFFFFPSCHRVKKIQNERECLIILFDLGTLNFTKKMYYLKMAIKVHKNRFVII